MDVDVGEVYDGELAEGDGVFGVGDGGDEVFFIFRISIPVFENSNPSLKGWDIPYISCSSIASGARSSPASSLSDDAGPDEG